MKHSIADKVHLVLRRQLGEATEDVPDAEQLRIIPAIADKYPHSIRLLEEAVADRRETWVHNCHTYTFGSAAQKRCYATPGARSSRMLPTSPRSSPPYSSKPTTPRTATSSSTFKTGW
jgi:hypothetical protein